MSAAANPVIDGASASRVNPVDDLETHHHQVKAFLNQFQPKNADEEQLVKNLAGIAWRIDRLPALDAELLARVSADNPASLRAFLNITVLNQRLNRQFDTTLKTLRSLQAERQAQEEKEMEAAVNLWELHRDEGTPFQPSADGFEFTSEQIELRIHQTARRVQARESAKKHLCDQALSAYQ